MKIFIVFILFCGFFNISLSSKPQSYVENISDPKEWKKLLRTRTNILVLYSQKKPKAEIYNIFVEVSRQLRGTATLVHIDCAGDGKKLCKKNHIDTSSYILKHYKESEFHKDYDRKESVQSISTFLKDPGGDLPWDEDPAGEDVVHINDLQALSKLMKREQSFLMMFYAPWCGFCKRLKPDYSTAASELKPDYTMAAMDVNKPENAQARIKFNITGFPTIIYFEKGLPSIHYDGENTKAGLMSFMKDPHQAPPKSAQDEAWSDTPSEVVHLTDDTFYSFVKSHSSVMVMFYAPWCGHCKKMKPEYVEAAAALKEMATDGYLAAVDSTKEKKLGGDFSVKGYPTLKYFQNGEFTFDVGSLRKKDEILEFMIDPKEPPPPPPPEKPWSETESSVVHLNDENFKSFLKKKKHVLVMFYAPWCGHCKKAKPELMAAADHFVDDPKVEFSAVDCTQFQFLCSTYEVRGYPSFIYFNYYKTSKSYDGGRTEADFIKFMNAPDAVPSAPAVPSPKEEWGSYEGSETILHLNEGNFDTTIRNKEVMVMFYAPWCGHCKAMKGEYCLAGKELYDSSVRDSRMLATVDATVERSLASRFNIKGFPTLIIFSNGVVAEEYNGGRNAAEISAHMKKRIVKKDEL